MNALEVSKFILAIAIVVVLWQLLAIAPLVADYTKFFKWNWEMDIMGNFREHSENLNESNLIVVNYIMTASRGLNDSLPDQMYSTIPIAGVTNQTTTPRVPFEIRYNQANNTVHQVFEYVFSSQLELIDKIRSEYLSINDNTKRHIPPDPKITLSPSPKYFETLLRNDRISTVQLLAPWTDVGSIIPSILYNKVIVNGSTYNNVPFTKSSTHISSVANWPKLKLISNNSHVTTAFLNIIRDGIVSPNGIVTHDNLVIQSNGCNPSVGIKFKTPKSAEDEVFTISQPWGYGYFHFVIENLPRIASFIPFLKNNPSIKIHVNQLNGFTERFLKSLGFTTNRLVTGTVTAKVIYLPSGTGCGGASVFPTLVLSSRLRNAFKQPSKKRRSVVVIKRSTRRWFDHHDSIWKMLQNMQNTYDFVLELFPDSPLPDFDEVVSMFQRAVMVVAPHGAGLSNIIFSEPGTVIIEGLCNKVNLCYSHLAYILGHAYHGILPNGRCQNTTAEMLYQTVSRSLEWLKKTNQL